MGARRMTTSAVYDLIRNQPKKPERQVMQVKLKKMFFITGAKLYLVLVLLALLVSATYAWFALSKTPSVSNIFLYATCNTGLEIALDFTDSDWGQQIDFSQVLDDSVVLYPATWSAENQAFLRADYGSDGRVSAVDVVVADTPTQAVVQNGYFVKVTYYARTDVTMDVSLAESVTLADETEGSGTYVMGMPIWDEEEGEHTNGGNGAENAIRVGFKITKYTLEETEESAEEESASQTQYTQEMLEAATAESYDFIIYEPNANAHNVYVDTSPDDEDEQDELALAELTEEEREDWLAEQALLQDEDALYLAASMDGYVNTPSVDGTATLVPSEYLYPQAACLWGDTTPAVRGEVGKILGDFAVDPYLFTISPNEVVKIELYLWVEGQDIDCLSVEEESQLFANIQFLGIYQTGSGLTSIEQETQDAYAVEETIQ